MENDIEKGPERIPTKAEVVEIIARHTESPKETVTLRELYDDKGLCLLDLRIEGEKPGNTSEYLYTKKGILPNGMETSLTSIEVTYHRGGEIISGDRVADYKHETGEWEEIK